MQAPHAAVRVEITRRHAAVCARLARLRAPWFDWIVPEAEEEDEGPGVVAGAQMEEEEAEWAARVRIASLEDPDSAEMKALLREREARDEARRRAAEESRARRAAMPTVEARVRLGLPAREVTRRVLGQCAMALHLAAVSECLFVEQPDSDAFLCAPAVAGAHVCVSLVLGTSGTPLPVWLRLEVGDPIPFLAESGTAWHISAAQGRSDPAQPATALAVPRAAATALYARRAFDALVQGVCVFVDSFARHAGADEDARAWLATWRAALNRLLEEPLRAYAKQARALDPACAGLVDLEACLARDSGTDAVSFVVSRRRSPYLASDTQQGGVLRAEAETLWRRASTIGLRPGEPTLFGADAAEVCTAVGDDAVFSRLLRLGWLALALSSGAFSFERPVDATADDDARAIRVYNACVLEAA